MSCRSCGVPADDIQHHYEIVVFEVRHVGAQDVGLDFQLDILKRERWSRGGVRRNCDWVETKKRKTGRGGRDMLRLEKPVISWLVNLWITLCSVLTVLSLTLSLRLNSRTVTCEEHRWLRRTRQTHRILSDLPDPRQSVLELLFHVAAVHHRLIRLCSCCFIYGDRRIQI